MMYFPIVEGRNHPIVIQIKQLNPSYACLVGLHIYHNWCISEFPPAQTLEKLSFFLIVEKIKSIEFLKNDIFHPSFC